MKISECIKLLQEHYDKFGDLDLYIYSYEMNDQKKFNPKVSLTETISIKDGKRDEFYITLWP